MLRAAVLWLGLSSATLASDLIIIIDDIGNNRSLGERTVALPGPLNLAFLPHTPHAHTLALMAHDVGHGIMLHAPMATESDTPLGKGGLYPDMSKEILQQTLSTSLNAIPNVQGINNHMGSLLTQKSEPMTWIMEIVKAHGLYFIDSLTSAKSVALHEARKAGIPSDSRHIFLDNQLDTPYLQKQFNEAVSIAKKNGHAILIGHPYIETLTFLNHSLTNLPEGIHLKRLDIFFNEQMWQEFDDNKERSRYRLTLSD